MTPKGRGMMGLVVWQQLEGRQFDTPDLDVNLFPASVISTVTVYSIVTEDVSGS
ncbi:unnamed protein product [Staurois parvus]|uniref:Uncharacterized protein n=1 Tax=Staurois parvus TaxID=386267 RepID=A0ABN9F4F2_9NEOB|nr:unnamed protein product [Staurois parvus]